MVGAPRSSEGRSFAAETRLVATPAAAGAARRFITDTLRGWNVATVVDDAVLCGSELVTNAVLHAGGSLVVRLSCPDHDVLLEVIDEVPIERGSVEPKAGDSEDDGDHMTGRGLALLASVAAAWGVNRRAMPGAAEGKVVWARLPIADGSRHDGHRRAPRLPSALPAAAAAASTAGEARLIDVPVDSLLASESHLDDVLRELLLAWWASPTDATIARLASRLGAFVARTGQLRTRTTALARQRVAAGYDRVTLVVDLGSDVVGAAEQLVETMDEVDAMARFGLLLTPPSSPKLTALRRWFAGELRRQSEGSRPLPCPFA
jgi:anti-sigma regulatory factor (Ser/Thr protein kinase)